MFINKKNLRKTDVVLLVAVVAIVVMSLVIIGSATHINTPSEERYWFVQRQGIFALINVAIAVFLMNFDYKMLQGYGNKIYIFNLIIAACMLPALNPIRNGQYISGGAMLQELYYSKPLVYIFIYLIINFLYAGAFATTALAASYYVDNIFMLSMVPFVLWYGINVISQYTVKTYHFNISPMKLVDIAQGYIVRPVPVISVLVVVALLSAVVYFLNGVKSDVY